MRDLIQTSFGRGRTLECIVNGPAWIDADRGQIEQVIMNLALNARDAIGAEGTVKIEVLPTTCSDHFSGDQPRREESVVLVVSDDGCGMTKHVADRAFDPFFTTKAHGMGTGLGLSVVDGIVAESAGAIEIDSVEGRGTKVRVSWPRVVTTR